jgi:hypothetical protein
MMRSADLGASRSLVPAAPTPEHMVISGYPGTSFC